MVKTSAYRPRLLFRIFPLVLCFMAIALVAHAQASIEPDDGTPFAGLDQPQPLPLTDVVLFASGVGFFQRSGVVTDDALV